MSKDNICPNCGNSTVQDHPENGCVLASMIQIVRERGNLDEKTILKLHSDCDTDALWEQLGRVIDKLEGGDLVQTTKKDKVMQYRFATSTNPLYWFCIELSEDGQMFSKRLTKEMITFDTKGRESIQVNEHGVVLFREQDTARRILSTPGNTVFDLQEYDRIAHAHQRHKELSMEGKIASAPQP